ncbi:DUF898 family protein [Phenylobacterium immobile]|uniref:DUF898 family protein n=1 Tax=Phenylobacterium immobile TaxID=21 RepID=UPI000AA57493|nr:DUF898 family protein [Phenylobacterium immobile]
MTDATTQTEGSITFAEDFDLKSFFKLSLITGFLTVITLGIYAPWGFTRVLKALAASVRINGDPLAYDGKGFHLFLGGWALLLVCYGPIVFLIVGSGGRLALPWVLPWIVIASFLAFAAGYVLLRYLAGHTLWRGARFALAGSPVAFALKAWVLMLLSGISLLWYLPAAYRLLSEHVISRLSIGDQPFAFDMTQAKSVPVYPMFAVYWAGMVLTNGLPMAFSNGSAAGASLVGMIVLVAMEQPFVAALAKAIARGTSFDSARFSLKIDVVEMIGMALACFALIILSLGLFLPVAMAIVLRFYVRRLHSEGAADLALIRPGGPAPNLKALLFSA